MKEKIVFDPTMHLHLGYYENNEDIEAVAYKVKNEEKWYVFLEEDTSLSIRDQSKYWPSYGYHIFIIDGEDLSYEEGCERLKEWLLFNSYIG